MLPFLSSYNRLAQALSLQQEKIKLPGRQFPPNLSQNWDQSRCSMWMQSIARVSAKYAKIPQWLCTCHSILSWPSLTDTKAEIANGVRLLDSRRGNQSEETGWWKTTGAESSHRRLPGGSSTSNHWSSWNHPVVFCGCFFSFLFANSYIYHYIGFLGLP